MLLFLDLPGVEHIADVGDGQGGLCNVRGNDNATCVATGLRKLWLAKEKKEIWELTCQ